MASTAATPNGSDAPSAKVVELRGVLASNGLKLKDSILARLAKSKSFQGLTPLTTLTLAQDAQPDLNRNAELGINTTPRTPDEEAGFEKKLEALNTQKPKQDASDTTAHILVSCGSSRKYEKHDVLPSSAPSQGFKALALADAALQSNSEKERKQCRSECFENVSDGEKLKLRAARFGIMHDAKEEAEKKRARAARFGIVDEDAKKRARLERFSKDSEQEDKEENEKRKARALRFATAIEKIITKVEEN